MIGYTLTIIFEITSLICIKQNGLMDFNSIGFQILAIIWYILGTINSKHHFKKEIEDESEPTVSHISNNIS